jgi:hypothetical protein
LREAAQGAARGEDRLVAKPNYDSVEGTGAQHRVNLLRGPVDRVADPLCTPAKIRCGIILGASLRSFRIVHGSDASLSISRVADAADQTMNIRMISQYINEFYRLFQIT